MKCWWAIVLGIDFGLLRAGVILFASQQPRGNAVVLLPPPAPIPIQVHVSGKLKKPGADSLYPESCVQKYVQAVGKITSQMDSSWTDLAAQLVWGTEAGSNPKRSPGLNLGIQCRRPANFTQADILSCANPIIHSDQYQHSLSRTIRNPARHQPGYIRED